MAKNLADNEQALEQDKLGSRPGRVRQIAQRKAAARSRKRRRLDNSPGGIHQRANKRISW
jgi:hypothetical protein